ncbi:MAG: helix-turn-helix transcriptional regulator [Lachnospiraceae bacterium]|nr:helix-turn-helix transcriptional regulator [Lachnospiraceae bacterium]
MRPEPTISYAPFWDTLKKSGISQYQLIHTYKISSATLNSIRKNRNLTLNTIEKLCQILNCRISDAVNFS